MADLKVKTLQQTHPDHDRALLDKHRALYEGGKTWRCLAQEWLPKNAKEPGDVYSDRCKRAFYSGDVGAMVDLLAAYLFGEPVQVDGIKADWYTTFLENVDGGGAHWDGWWKERFLDALVGQQAFVWINPPARPADVQPKTRADEEAAGLLDVRLVPLAPEQVIDWEEDEQGNLLWLMVHGITERREDVTQPRTRVHRWTWVGREQIRRWEWKATEKKRDPSPEDMAEELAPVEHNIGRHPVVRLQLPSGLWALNKLYDLAVALTRRENDLDWSLHRAAHALMTVHSKWGDEEPVLGPGYFLKLGLEDKVDYAEPSGVSFEAQAQHVKTLREQLYRVLHQMAASAESDAGRTRMSGESKARDWQALEIVLSAYGRLIRDAMHRTLEVVAAARGEELSDLAVKGLDSWQLEDLQSFLEAALIGQGLVKSETYHREVAKRIVTRQLQDEIGPEKVQAIHDELDVADYAPAPSGPEAPPPRLGPGARRRARGGREDDDDEEEDEDEPQE